MRVHVRNYTCYIQSSEVGVWLTSSLMREYVMASVCLVSSTLWTWLDQKEPLVLETEERGSKVSTITKINMAFIMAILYPVGQPFWYTVAMVFTYKHCSLRIRAHQQWTSSPGQCDQCLGGPQEACLPHPVSRVQDHSAAERLPGGQRQHGHGCLPQPCGC